MATFEELMGAAVNADKAGDTEAAQMLVDMARSLRPPEQGETPYPGLYQASEDAPLVPASADWEGRQGSARQVDRFGDTIRAATKAHRAATSAYARGVVDPSQSPTAQILPEWVPESVRDEVAMAGDIAGTAIGAAGTVYGFGAGLAGEMFGGSPTNEKKLARDPTMMGTVAAPELAGVSGAQIAAGKAARAAQQLDAPGTDLQRGARAADDMGITPSLGAGGKLRATTAATMEKVPFSGSVIAKDAVRFVDEVETAFNRTVRKLGEAGAAPEAGGALQAGLNSFVTNFKERSGALFSKVGEKIPNGTKIQANETAAAIREAIAPFEGTPKISQELGLNKWAALADDLESGNLTWRAALDLRSSIGESIGAISGPLAGMDKGKMKLAYSKLTEDLETAARAAGPDAEKAWKRANNYYRRGAERIQSSLDKTIKADSPERAFEAFVNMTKKDRASADSKRVFAIKASMPKEEWNNVAASIVDRMGRARPGAQGADGDTFSPAVFLTEWNKLSDEAKSALFPQEVRKEMNDLAAIADMAKGANAERNFSNTGTVVTGAGVGAGLANAPLTTGSILAGSFLSAKALTSPRMLRALNRHARGDAKLLRTIANGGSPLAQEARTILRMTAAESAAGDAANSVTQPIRRVAPQ